MVCCKFSVVGSVGTGTLRGLSYILLAGVGCLYTCLKGYFRVGSGDHSRVVREASMGVQCRYRSAGGGFRVRRFVSICWDSGGSWVHLQLSWGFSEFLGDVSSGLVVRLFRMRSVVYHVFAAVHTFIGNGMRSPSSPRPIAPTFIAARAGLF